MVCSGNQAVYVTGTLARTVTIGIVAMLLMVGISALVQVANSRINIKNLNP